MATYEIAKEARLDILVGLSLLLGWLSLISGMHLREINFSIILGILSHLIRIDFCPVKTVPIIDVDREQF